MLKLCRKPIHQISGVSMLRWRQITTCQTNLPFSSTYQSITSRSNEIRSMCYPRRITLPRGLQIRCISSSSKFSNSSKISSTKSYNSNNKPQMMQPYNNKRCWLIIIWQGAQRFRFAHAVKRRASGAVSVIVIGRLSMKRQSWVYPNS